MDPWARHHHHLAQDVWPHPRHQRLSLAAVYTTTTNDQVNPSVTRLEDGNFVVVWESAAGATVDIVGQVFDATGGALGSEFSINTFDLEN